MPQLLQQDLHAVLVRIPKDVRQMVKDNGFMIGGGFIREIVAGEKPRDIDIFGSDKQKMIDAGDKLNIDRGRKARIIQTKNAMTMVEAPRQTIQFIYRWLYDEPKLVNDSLDFTVCQATVYWDGTQWTSIISEWFYPDLASRRLRYTTPDRNEDAGGSMLRVRKFLHRGYHIDVDSMAMVIARMVAAVNVDKLEDMVGRREKADETFYQNGTPDYYREAANTREEALQFIFKGLLREVDPLLVVDGVEPIENEHEAVE